MDQGAYLYSKWLKNIQKVQKDRLGRIRLIFQMLASENLKFQQYIRRENNPKKEIIIITQRKIYEIRIHQQLSHPNVVHLDHWFQDQHFQYIFMQYCPNGNLQKKLQSMSKMSQKNIRFYTRQIINAIMYIHSKNILHRDLKLCNFYLDTNQDIKLGDFGFACQLSHKNQLKRQTCGTPNYIAPQAISGFGYSFSSDVWAVGVILFRLKFKACPFQGRSVRQTLQKVKTCNYSFSKSIKISDELKDLIQKIFNINYDERLTLQQILSHPFFQKQQKLPARGNSETTSFSIIRNLFSREKDIKSNKRPSIIDDRQKNKVKESQQLNKRSNSCETFKQIKQIFKNKSKGTLATSNQTDYKGQDTFGASNLMISQTSKEKSGEMTTLRSQFMIQTSMGISMIGKKLQNNHNRANNFLGNVKQQLKIQNKAKGTPSISNTQKQTTTSSQQLTNLTKKYYLPYQIQRQNEVTIIHYKISIKQIIYNNISYLIHRNKQNIYNMNGTYCSQQPKILKYVVQNRLKMQYAQPQEQQYGEIDIEKILLFVSHKWIILKDGIILRYGLNGVFIAKMLTQQLFYAGTAVKDGEILKQQGKISLMYLKQVNNYKCAQGVVLSRIYQGWISNSFKKHALKQ